MNNRQLESQCYLRLWEFEIALRRVVRWEFMKEHGKSWLLNTGDYSDTIVDRIQKESINGFVRGNSPYLSYLTLYELQKLIFKDYWQKHFYKIFTGKKFLQKDLTNKIIPVRNKIAHFRSVTQSELSYLLLAAEILEHLKLYYQQENLTEFYFSGEEERSSELIDPTLLMTARSALARYKHAPLLDEFLNLQWLRNYDTQPGMGIYDRHIFFEFRILKSRNLAQIFQWIEKKEYEVSFASFRPNPCLLRVFIPLFLDGNEILKMLRTLCNLLKTAPAVLSASPTDAGIFNEILIDSNDSNNLSFAF